MRRERILLNETKQKITFRVDLKFFFIIESRYLIVPQLSKPSMFHGHVPMAVGCVWILFRFLQMFDLWAE